MIRAFIIDDSALMRAILTDILDADPDIQVVGQASDPYEAWQKVQRVKPDVITLDIEMPRMDGLSFLEKLMRTTPLPVIMVSSYTTEGHEATLRSLELGAVDFVAKPRMDVEKSTLELADEIRSKVRTAANVNLSTLLASQTSRVTQTGATPFTRELILLAASTGGTEAIRTVVASFPQDCPPVLVVQHMPKHFTRSFAERLDRQVTVAVREASPREDLDAGTVLIAPGGQHLRVTPGRMAVETSSDRPTNGHRPSADVLFDSAVPLADKVVAAVLTGMGRDGAAGLLRLRKAGALTFAQDRESSVVFGMPGEADRLGAALEMVPISQIGSRMVRAARAPSQ